MKKMLTALAVGLVFATSATCSTVDFNPNGSQAGNWSYNGAGTFSFVQDITVICGLDNPGDSLVGAFVHIPNLTVSGGPGSYTMSGGVIEISNSSTPGGGIAYLNGTLGTGDLTTVGTIGAIYSVLQADITTITIANPIGSAALDAIGDLDLDFELTMSGGSGPGYNGFAQMIAGNYSGSGTFSGSMTVIPEPLTISMLGIGGLWLLRHRKKIEHKQ